MNADLIARARALAKALRGECAPDEEAARLARAFAAECNAAPQVADLLDALAAEVEHLRARAEVAEAWLHVVEHAAAEVTARAGCGDNGCRFVGPAGMATNGGCRCLGREGGARPLLIAALAKLYHAVIWKRTAK